MDFFIPILVESLSLIMLCYQPARYINYPVEESNNEEWDDDHEPVKRVSSFGPFVEVDDGLQQ